MQMQVMQYSLVLFLKQLNKQPTKHKLVIGVVAPANELLTTGKQKQAQQIALAKNKTLHRDFQLNK